MAKKTKGSKSTKDDFASSASSTSILEESDPAVGGGTWAVPSTGASVNSSRNRNSNTNRHNDSHHNGSSSNNNNNNRNSRNYPQQNGSTDSVSDWRGDFAASVGPQLGIPYILDNGLPSVPVLARGKNAQFHDCIKAKDWEKVEKLLKKFDANYYKKKHLQVKERRDAELLRLQQEEEEAKEAAEEGKEETESPRRSRRFLRSFSPRRRKASKDRNSNNNDANDATTTPNNNGGGIASKILPKALSTKLIVDPEDVLSPLLMVDDDERTPLHLALIHKAPEAMLLDLLKCEKKAAMMQDTNGQVPLHCAVASWQFDHVLEKVIRAYPHALKTKDEHGKTPVGLGVQLARERQAEEFEEDIENPFLWIHPTSKEEKNWQFQQEKNWNKVNFLLKALMKRNKSVLPSEHGLILEALEGGANPNTINRLVSTADRYLIADDELAGTAIGLCVERHYTLDTLEYVMENCRERTTVINDAVTKALRTHYRQGCHQLNDGVTPFGKQVIDWAKQTAIEKEANPNKKKKKKKAKKKKNTKPKKEKSKPSLKKKLSVRFLGKADDEPEEDEQEDADENDTDNEDGEKQEESEEEEEEDEEEWEGMDKSCKQWWDILNYLIFYSAYGRNFKETVKPKSYHLLHAALSIPVTPPSLIQLLLIVYPESKRELCPCYHALPVHIACTRWRYDIIRNESDTSLDKVLKLMVKSDKEILFRRHKGRLPVHLALSVGQSWTFLKAFVSVDKKCVGMRDTQSRFFPFQMAALPMTSKNVQLLMRSQFTPTEWRTMSTMQKRTEYQRVEVEQDRRQIGTIFELLRRHPDAINGQPLYRQNATSSSSSSALRKTGKVSMQYLGFVYGKNSQGEFRLRAENVKLLRDAIVRADIPLEMENWWEQTKECIWEEYNGDLPRDDLYLLHAALYNPETPPLLVELLLEIFPASVSKPVPGTATYPLHIAAGTTAYHRHPFEMPYGMDNLHLVLSAGKRLVRRRSNGRLPLHICLSRGKSWKEVRPLVMAFPSSLMMEDPQTGLVPFQLMASFKLTSRENALRYSAFIERHTRNVDLQRLSAKDKALAFNRIRKKQELTQVTCIFELLRHRPSAMYPAPVGYTMSDAGSVHSTSVISLGSRGSDMGGAVARVGDFLGESPLPSARPSSIRGLNSPSPMSSRSLIPTYNGEGSIMSLVTPEERNSARRSPRNNISSLNHSTHSRTSADGSGVYGSRHGKIIYDDDNASFLGNSSHSFASLASGTSPVASGRKTPKGERRAGKRPPKLPPRVPDLER
ncbi:MAG: hypothetical protein SGILL_001092 [Bacillariaceae sp.]